MPLGAARLTLLAKGSAGPVLSNVWEEMSEITDPFTNVNRFTGVTEESVHIAGVQNSGNLVMLVGAERYPRGTGWYIYPCCYDLVNDTFAVGTPVTPSAGYNTGDTSNYRGIDINGEGANAAVTAPDYNVGGNGFNIPSIQGIRITNWGSITTTNLPTLSLGIKQNPYTAGACFYQNSCAYLGNNRFAVANRIPGLGDVVRQYIYTHSNNSSATMSSYNTANNLYGGQGLAFQPEGIQNGMSSANFAVISDPPGGNANTLADTYAQGNATNHNLTIPGSTTFPGASMSSFRIRVVRDDGGDVYTLNHINSSQRGVEYKLNRWANYNSPGSAPSITQGTLNNTLSTLNFFVSDNKDGTNSFVYVPVYEATDNKVRFDQIGYSFATQVIDTSETTGTNTNTSDTYITGWDNYWKPFYDATYGYSIFHFSHNRVSTCNFMRRLRYVP